jgi:hypothetical protein
VRILETYNIKVKSENVKGKYRFGVLEEDERAMLKCNFMKQDVRMWAGLITFFIQANADYILFP